MIEESKSEKISGFIMGCLRLGYSYQDAYDLLLNSKQGKGLLDNEYTYLVHLTGIATAEKADEDFGYKYSKTYNIQENFHQIEMLGYFIEFAHKEYNLEYKYIFKKMNLDTFMERFGIVLGNYDNKIVKNFLI